MWSIDLSAEWSDGSGFFTAFRMTEGRGVCHSEERSDEESRSAILTNESRVLGSGDAKWSILDSSRSE